ncbi:hypothetical protein HZ326_4097 [Fusarium oxysporum f. sp. albedinis]|nr:hypothetical protein HZ326_4097 [Fusarium oxysporum f. sp. albedinis]
MSRIPNDTNLVDTVSVSSLGLSRQLTPLSPMENERTPDGPFVMQHRAVESFTVEQALRVSVWRSKAARDPSKPSSAFKCPIFRPSRAFSSESHGRRWKGVEIDGQWR